MLLEIWTSRCDYIDNLEQREYMTVYLRYALWMKVTGFWVKEKKLRKRLSNVQKG